MIENEPSLIYDRFLFLVKHNLFSLRNLIREIILDDFFYF